MQNKFIVPAFVLAALFSVGAISVSAETEGTQAIEAVTTTSAPTPATLPQPAMDGKDRAAHMQALVAQWRAKLAEMRKDKPAKEEKRDANMHSDMLGKSLAQVDASCMQKAVDVREVAIQKSWSTLSTTLSGALTVRQKALYDAWESEDRATYNKTVREAWSAWNTSHRNAHRALNNDRKTAWRTFRDTARNECKVTLPKEEEEARETAGAITL